MSKHTERAHALLSASSAHRWLACPPSAVAAELYPQQDTEFTREGTLAHEVAEFFVGTVQAPTSSIGEDLLADFKNYMAAEDITMEVLECAASYRDYIQEQIKSDNITMLLEQRVDFSPWVPEGFGTADCILIQGDTMDVIDYKYGKGVAVSAEDNPQMKLYGLGALNDFGFAYDIKTVRLHIFQPRINNISIFELSVDELLAWGESIKPIAEKAAKGKGKYNAGEHCRFCPHAGKCRTLTKTCTEHLETHGVKAPVKVLAPWEVAEVLKMEPLVSLWLKRVKDQALTSLLNGEEIPGYKVVEGKKGNRAWADALRVMEILNDNGYSKEDYTETRLLSPAGMDQALGKKRAAELLGCVITRAPGKPTVVETKDKRPAYDRLAEAQKDFE